MFDLLGRLAVGHPRKVLLVWLSLAVLLTAIAPCWETSSQDDDVRFLPDTYPSVRAYHLLERAFPKDTCVCKAVFALERSNGPLTADDYALVDRMAQALKQLDDDQPDLKIAPGILTHSDPMLGSRLTSADRQCTLIQLPLDMPFMALQVQVTVDRAFDLLQAMLAEAHDPHLKLYLTGPAGFGRDLVKATSDSLDHTTIATVLLVIVVLLLIYRAPGMAMIPLLTIGIAAWVAVKVLALVTLIPGVHLVNISQVFAIVILFGAGTDYCLFLIARYREELEAGESGPMAVRRGLGSVGGALAASAGTVICGLGMMGFAEFGKIRCAGPVIALALAIGLAAALTLTPALLKLSGRRAFWPRTVERRLPGVQRRTLWDAISRVVVRRPLLLLSLSLAVLIPPALVGLSVVPTFKPTGDLNPSSDSIVGLNAVQSRFTAGETGPISVLLIADFDWNTPQGREVIAFLSRGFSYLDNVAEVRSLTQPLGRPQPELVQDPPPQPQRQSKLGQWFRQRVEGLAEQIRVEVRKRYTSAPPPEPGQPQQYYARIEVVTRSDPFDQESIRTLEQIETWVHQLLPLRPDLMSGVRAECHGVTAHTRDMAVVVAGDRARVNNLVLLGIFLILMVLVRNWWLAAYLLVTVLLSYYATLGLTALFASHWAGRPLGPIEWRVPFFLFTILVAIGEDYNILLITRIFQERKRHGDSEGVRRGLSYTGGTITACGIIMAGTFSTLMLGNLGTLIQIGFALAVGVLIDTLIVRPFLVPAFLMLVWRRPEEPTILRLATPISTPAVPLRRAG